jgi:acyl-homoserine-lactone acylase
MAIKEKRSFAILIIVLATACSDSSDNGRPAPEPEPPVAPATYSAEIRRTEYGIAHIKAEDWGSLGYGQGYAFAQDSYCIAMREVLFSTGRSAEYMGEERGSVSNDFLMRYLLGSREQYIEQVFPDTDDPVYQLLSGYAAGMNRYLRETGSENLPGGDDGCEDGSWAIEVEAVDLSMMFSRLSLRLSSDFDILRNGILESTGPTDAAATVAPDEADLEASRHILKQLRHTLANTGTGSNGLAIGGERTQTGAGMLLSNTHQSWRGIARWHQVHLTIPGVLDVAGASPQGLGGAAMGFTPDLSWTFTNSFTNRFTLYELSLDPDNPLRYRYEDEWREIKSEEVVVKVLLPNGALQTRSRDFYRSHYGPIVNLQGLLPLLDGWPMFNGTVLSLRDANLPVNNRFFSQILKMSTARDIAEFARAQADIGNPLWHTLAADKNGKVFYGEVAAIPHVTQAQLDTCISGVVGPLLASSSNQAFLSLDGSREFCEWGQDEDTPEGTNLYGYEARPTIISRDYVANSNNSYWLTNPDTPLEGFPTLFGWLGHENQQQFLRTRLGHLAVAERAESSDGLSDTPGFTLSLLQDLMFSGRVYAAEITLDDVLQLCASIPPAGDSKEREALRACLVLANWDRRVNLESRGAQVFTEFWRVIVDELSVPFAGVVQSDEFWQVDFDPADPVNTPRGIDLVEPENYQRVVNALAIAVRALDEAGVALDAPWSEISSFKRNNERIPLHGGWDTMGAYSYIGSGLEQGGYINPGSGNSYIATVTWDGSECPVADVLSVYSQSSDPESDHYADQTRLYSDKRWVRFPFCENDIQAQQIGETLLIEE